MTYKNYPAKARDNALMGYVYNRTFHKCKNQIGVRTAIKLMNHEALSITFIKKIHSYLSRAKVYVGDESKCGWISFQLWGGYDMLEWTERILKKEK